MDAWRMTSAVHPMAGVFVKYLATTICFATGAKEPARVCVCGCQMYAVPAVAKGFVLCS